MTTTSRDPLRDLPVDLLDVLASHGFGLQTRIPAWQQEPLAALLIECMTEPTLAHGVAWVGAIRMHCAALSAAGNLEPDDQSSELCHDLVEAVLEWRSGVASETLTGAERTARMDELVELWMLAVREGAMRPTAMVCVRLQGLWESYADRNDVGRAADIALIAAEWAPITELGECAGAVARWRAHAVGCLAEAGRFDELIALASEWELVRVCEEELGDDADDTFRVHIALAAAYRAREAYDQAVEHARAAVWAAECGLGTDHAITLAALAQLGMTLLAADRADEAIGVARHAYELAQPHAERRPEDVAHAALGVALCLHALGDHDDAEAFARPAFKTARHRLGPYHPHTDALRRLAGEPDDT